MDEGCAVCNMTYMLYTVRTSVVLAHLAPFTPFSWLLVMKVMENQFIILDM